MVGGVVMVDSIEIVEEGAAGDGGEGIWGEKGGANEEGSKGCADMTRVEGKGGEGSVGVDGTKGGKGDWGSGW